MPDNRTNSAIDMAFQIVDSPVYVVSRHGWKKRCLSRSAALNNLAHYMTTRAFRIADVRTHYPDKPVERDGVTVYEAGSHTLSYRSAHHRCIRRLRRLLARKREMQKWCEKWDAMHNRFVKEMDALQASKPEGLR